MLDALILVLFLYIAVCAIGGFLFKRLAKLFGDDPT